MANIEKRTSKDGQHTYRAKVRLKGFPPQSATFNRITDARKWLQDTESAIREGRYFKNNAARKNTLADLIDRYFEEVLPTKKKDIKNQKHYLNWWKKELGSYTLIDLSPSLITTARAKLMQTKSQYNRSRSQTTVNRYTTALGALFTIAVNDWEWMKDNPIRRISKFSEHRGRVRFLDDDERKRLLESCKRSSNPHLYDIVVLALSTGARKSEILNLRWKDVDLNRGMIKLEETKNDERRVIPLQGYAQELIKKKFTNRALGCDYVFNSETKCQPIEIKRAWYEVMEAAKIEDFRFHDLRHSAASYLAMNGASIAEIAGVLGHKTLQMVKRYAHLSEAHTTAVVANMNKKIFGNG